MGPHGPQTPPGPHGPPRVFLAAPPARPHCPQTWGAPWGPGGPLALPPGPGGRKNHQKPIENRLGASESPWGPRTAPDGALGATKNHQKSLKTFFWKVSSFGTFFWISADIPIFTPLDPLEGLWGPENRIPDPQIHPDTHSEPNPGPGGSEHLVLGDFW